MEVADPGLLELDNGATVPFWSHLEAYKHLGIWKRADGGNAPHTWADVKKKNSCTSCGGSGGCASPRGRSFAWWRTCCCSA